MNHHHHHHDRIVIRSIVIVLQHVMLLTCCFCFYCCFCEYNIVSATATGSTSSTTAAVGGWWSTTTSTTSIQQRLFGRIQPNKKHYQSYPTVSSLFSTSSTANGKRRTTSSSRDDQKIVIDYLQQQQRQCQHDDPSHDSTTNFHIHGWKWHTMSFIHEMKRLNDYTTMLLLQQQKQQRQSSSSLLTSTISSTLQKGIDYVIGFNMNGLHKIESDLFFPWIRKMITTTTSSNKSIKVTNEDTVVPIRVHQAFTNIMIQLESDQQQLHSIGTKLVQFIHSTTTTKQRVDTTPNDHPMKTSRTNGSSKSKFTSSFQQLLQVLPVAIIKTKTITTRRNDQSRFGSSRDNNSNTIIIIINRINDDLNQMIQLATNIFTIEETILIPMIQYHISQQDQLNFNNLVLRKLGIFNSRLHLVGMYQAIIATTTTSTNNNSNNVNNNELQTFQQVIPSIAQTMIPHWKRTLYNPTANIYK